MSAQDDFLEFSFRGVPFLAKSHSVEGGRKTATHEFVNTNRRNVQDLGEFLNKFSINAIITQNTDGTEFRNKVNALITALKTTGPGVLTHQILGEFQVVAKMHDIDFTDSSIGEARFKLEFEQVENAIAPQPTNNTESQVSFLQDKTFNNIDDFVSDIFSVTSGFADSFLDAVSKVEEFIDDTTNFVQDILSLPNSASEFISKLNNISRDINSLINAPAELASELISVFSAFDGISNSAELKYRAVKRFFDFGDKDAKKEIGSFENQEIERNRAVINQAVQVAALAEAYSQSANRASTQQQPITDKERDSLDIFQILITGNKAKTLTSSFSSVRSTSRLSSSSRQLRTIGFFSVEELEEVEQELEAQFQKVSEQLFDESSRPVPRALSQSFPQSVPQNLYNSLQALRVKFSEFVKQVKPTLSRTEIITVQPQPASVLAYSLYGDSSRAQEILLLNDLKDNIEVSGEIKVLTA